MTGTLTAKEQGELKSLEELLERVSKPEHQSEHWTARQQEDDEPGESFTRPGYMLRHGTRRQECHESL